MNVEKLIRMANEIARNLRALPGDQPSTATAEHLRSFWTPGMRATLIACTRSGDAALDPIALQAVEMLGTAAADGAPPPCH